MGCVDPSKANADESQGETKSVSGRRATRGMRSAKTLKNGALRLSVQLHLSLLLGRTPVDTWMSHD